MAHIQWRLAFAALLLVTGVGAGAGMGNLGPEPERLVEGHIVFVTIEPPPINFTKNETAAAVAVLVRERTHHFLSLRNPGVLWFNDQYLVDPEDNTYDRDFVRYPCTGAVLAVGAGDPNPAMYPRSDYNSNTYVETYSFVDPNNRAWDVHKWSMTGGFVWSVGLYQSNFKSDEPDDGFCDREPVKDRARSTTTPSHGYTYPCGGNGGPACTRGVWYNAVLYFFLDDLPVAGPAKNHTDGSADWHADVSGCHENGSTGSLYPQQWPCPAGDDDREGNSHPYNPRPTQIHNRERNTHGYSADCTGDGIFDRECHATRKIDLYYGVAPHPLDLTPPVPPNYRVLDVTGSTAPYHCHQPMSGYTDYCT